MSIINAFFKALVIPIGVGVVVMIIVQGIGFTIGQPDLLTQSLESSLERVPELVDKVIILLDRCIAGC